MRRMELTPRAGWVELAEKHGFVFHTENDLAYWDETHAYVFTLQQIERDLEDPTDELAALCYDAVDRVVQDERLLTRVGVPGKFHDLVRNSWVRGDRDLYGRFDFRYDGTGPAKLYEFNADTPTTLYESAVFQWIWLEQRRADGTVPEGSDQFNSIHERLVEAFKGLGINGPLHLAAISECAEDFGTVDYLRDCALQAGLDARFIHLQNVGIDASGYFTDMDDCHIEALFKLYPWEHMVEDSFGALLPADRTRFIEPPWKMVAASKGILPILWDMAPNHPNLLPTFFEDDPRAKTLTNGAGARYVRKPIFSREGQNVTIVRPEAEGGTLSIAGDYANYPHIIQEYAPLTNFGGEYPMLGSWLVAGNAAGLGIRAEDGLVTFNGARFVPHVIIG